MYWPTSTLQTSAPPLPAGTIYLQQQQQQQQRVVNTWTLGCCASAKQIAPPDARIPGIRGLRYARRKTSLQHVLAFLLAETSELCSVQIYQTLIASIFCSASVCFCLCLHLHLLCFCLLLSAWFCPALICISTYARMYQQYYARLPTQPWPVPGRFVLESF
jgi:hypothetical protein